MKTVAIGLASINSRLAIRILDIHLLYVFFKKPWTITEYEENYNLEYKIILFTN